MKANRTLRKIANDIARKYCRWMPIGEIQNMYAQLNAVGITTDCFHNEETSCKWYYYGEEVENSLFVLTMYKGAAEDGRAEFNVYFS